MSGPAHEVDPVLDPDQVAGLQQLATLSGSDLLPQLVETFARRTDALVAVVLGDPSPPELAAAAHELKGSASTIGATRLAGRASDLEARGRSGLRIDPGPAAELAREAGQAVAALRALTASSDGGAGAGIG